MQGQEGLPGVSMIQALERVVFSNECLLSVQCRTVLYSPE